MALVCWQVLQPKLAQPALAALQPRGLGSPYPTLKPAPRACTTTILSYILRRTCIPTPGQAQAHAYAYASAYSHPPTLPENKIATSVGGALNLAHMSGLSGQPWKCALVTGGGGGLGKVLAKSLIKHGKKVYLAGRTGHTLAQTTNEINAAGYFVVDVGDVSSLGAFASRVLSEAPEIDCLVNNAGVQKPVWFERGVELDVLGEEINTNITGLVYLCALFVPHLTQKPHGCIVNVSSILAYAPLSSVPAFVKSFTVALREQLRGTSVLVVEIAPPMVESDLHREHANPDNNKKVNTPEAMSQDEWIAEVEQAWDGDTDEIGAGFAQVGMTKWRDTFGEMHQELEQRFHFMRP
ncbi:Oxidoreductase DltE [Ceratobasidium theobromae]|uniref:Oxidoreductase DltE n=1 Tax=Ceratobasidium theobromae TaxID=1582974 RepID=A0A5N5QFE1_9AGAM|nr:Oxidoreductase DltE [Ceratobasidium theobromae]